LIETPLTVKVPSVTGVRSPAEARSVSPSMRPSPTEEVT
jgi:hypothetical protein